MSERMLRRLFVALVVLIVAWAGVTLASGRTGSAAAPDSELERVLDRIADDSLAGATIASPVGDRVELTRAAGGWSVNGFRADSQAVARARDAIAAARVAALAGRNAANHARFGLVEDSAWSVLLRGARDSARILIGQTGPGFGSAFVRLPDRDEVWQVDGDLRDAFARPLADWRDRTIARVDAASIRSLVLQRGDTTTTLVRGDSAWTLGDGGPAADSARVAQLLDALADLAATGFGADSTDLADTQMRRLLVLGAAGDTLAAIEFLGREFDWYARVPGDPETYRLSGYTVDRLTPARQELGR